MNAATLRDYLARLDAALPAVFRDDVLVQQNLNNVSRDMLRWLP